MDDKLTHLDEYGRASMVDVGDKPDSARVAVAEGYIYMRAETLALIEAGDMAKGDVFGVARIAGIMAAKRTSELIPLCHPLPLHKISVTLSIDHAGNRVRVEATARTTGKTGVEMEALTAVNVAALTVYDMAKAVDRAMQIGGIRLLEKRGGVRGDYHAEEVDDAG
ncbi:MAG: cyclic pyranopterin monophosphate synthase MoaC [Anaerolineaceae bacterium]|nr:MAG: cyclic pyranopterin monophosphate synthase MoaC [Anaerolineaceae bacterium]